MSATAPTGWPSSSRVLTDNRNRTGAEVRHILTKNNGSMAEPNAVAWNFEKKGLLLVPQEAVDEESLMELVLEAGAEDLEPADDLFEIHTSPDAFESVREALEKNKIQTESAEITNAAQINGEARRQASGTDASPHGSARG